MFFGYIVQHAPTWSLAGLAFGLRRIMAGVKTRVIVTFMVVGFNTHAVHARVCGGSHHEGGVSRFSHFPAS